MIHMVLQAISSPSLRPPLPVQPSLDLPRVTEAAATAKANVVFMFVSGLCQSGQCRVRKRA